MNPKLIKPAMPMKVIVALFVGLLLTALLLAFVGWGLAGVANVFISMFAIATVVTLYIALSSEAEGWWFK